MKTSIMLHSRQAFRKQLLVGFLLLLAFAIFSTSSMVSKWDGGFAQAEYRLRFVDPAGNPVQGVRLTVTDTQGRLSYGYPVTDYLPDSILVSNRNGELECHHVNLSPEFGGACHYLFFCIPVGNCAPPHYNLEFSLHDLNVAIVPYLDLDKASYGSEESVEKPWPDLYSSPATLPFHLRPENRVVPPPIAYVIVRKTLIVRTDSSY